VGGASKMLIIIFAQGSIAKANYRLGGTTVIFSEIDFIQMLHIVYILLKRKNFLMMYLAECFV
jgi:hypothetical protein